MRGRLWLVVGVLAGVGVAAGRVPYLAGAARSLAGSAEHLVLSGSRRLINGAARRGAPRRVVQGAGAAIAVLVPGLSALLLVVAAKATMRIRAVVAALIVIVGLATYAYQPHGEATGALILAVAVAVVAVALSGPLLVAPLGMGAGLITAGFLPTLFSKHSSATATAVQSMHLALFNTPGDPIGLQLAMLIVALIPLAVAAKLVLD